LQFNFSIVLSIVNGNDTEDDEDDPEQPKTTAQGKLKLFKCKQCDFASAIKKEYWDHTKTHIKADKMLKCPKCPFVTEYKHHLEYHVRNHVGSKPFKCNKCSYSCVNKSMLNSHMKSHSNVYQYRCADCAYATKYCHSLKLHLRKYGHNPDVVLNADGTPNPLPIIDVYGTRRGPKVKKDENGMPLGQQKAPVNTEVRYRQPGLLCTSRKFAQSSKFFKKKIFFGTKVTSEAFPKI
jgi:hunchback-like protein